MQRTEIQSDLILLGYYYYLVDGQFGTGTFNALIAFQRRPGPVKTASCRDADINALRGLAAKV